MADTTALVQSIQEWAEIAARLAAEQVLEETRSAAPVGETGGGATRDSLRLEQTGPYSWEIIADTPQAQFTDEGTQGPYVIRAVNARVLSFPWANGPDGPGQYHFRYVTHPGIRAQHWFAEPMPDRWEQALENQTSG